MILVELLNFTFDPRIDIKLVSNVKFIPLAYAPTSRSGADVALSRSGDGWASEAGAWSPAGDKRRIGQHAGSAG
jgi:hypothetical protein